MVDVLGVLEDLGVLVGAEIPERCAGIDRVGAVAIPRVPPFAIAASSGVQEIDGSVVRISVAPASPPEQSGQRAGPTSVR